MTTADTATVTRSLPATGVTVPAEPVLVLTAVRKWRAIDGEGFVATVRVGDAKGRVLGTIEQEGHGGGTWLRPADARGRVEFDAYVEACKTANPEHFGFTADETVCNDLFEEHDLAKRLTAARKRGTTALRKGTDRWNPDVSYDEFLAPGFNPFPYFTVKSPDTADLRAHAITKGFTLVWGDSATWEDIA